MARRLMTRRRLTTADLAVAVAAQLFARSRNPYTPTDYPPTTRQELPAMNDTPPTTTRPAPTEKQREVSTVLAALRYWQEYTSTTERNYDPHFTNDDGEPIIAPLTDAEIDALCVRVKRHLA